MKFAILLLGLFLIEILYFKIADKFNIIDKPNQRSSHTKITLRGGGIIFYIGTLLYFIIDGFQYPWFFAGLTLIAAISFADDIRPQSAKLRLLVHFISMLLMFYQWDLFSLPWYFTLLALVLSVGIINAYNFMDGINGITGGYSLVLLIAFWFINNYQVSFIDNELIYFIGLAVLVFDIFNFRIKAKCFAGDVGAVSIAFVIVFMLGLLIIKTHDFSYIILLAVYGVDSMLTIVHRIMLKENIFEAHRKHAYQIMANELKIKHIYVSLIYMVLQAVIIFGYIMCFEYRYIYTISAFAVLGIVYIIFMKKFFHLHLQSSKKAE